MIRAYMLLFLTVCLAFLVGDDVQAVTVMSNTEILRQTEPITAYTLAGRATTINLPTTLMLPSYRVSYQELNALLAAYGLTGSAGYQITGLGKPQLLTVHQTHATLKQAHQTTKQVDGRNQVGYAGELTIKNVIYHDVKLRGTTKIKLFMPRQKLAVFQLDAGLGKFTPSNPRVQVTALPGEQVPEATFEQPHRPGYRFDGWRLHIGHHWQKVQHLVARHCPSHHVIHAYACWRER
ncbi:hypothetical protein [Weissella cibaria]|uniref:hypothetical protein n=1 Tax=Weissella cibaria TaxID=137591 RepID=UPI00215A2EBE|nr:hypothetical protein [Weissella cibaria]